MGGVFLINIEIIYRDDANAPLSQPQQRIIDPIVGLIEVGPGAELVPPQTMGALVDQVDVQCGIVGVGLGLSFVT